MATRTIIKNPEKITHFIESYSFATIITLSEDLQVSHLPFLIRPNEGDKGYLYGHFAKANQHWQHIEQNVSLIIFNGPHAYISPTWYHRKPAVPTWNYTSARIEGKATLCDKTQTLSIVEQMQDFYEPDLKNSDAVSDSHTYKLLDAIIGFKIKIETIEAKFKLGLHRSLNDQKGLMEGLNQSDSVEAQQLLKFMQTWGYLPEQAV